MTEWKASCWKIANEVLKIYLQNKEKYTEEDAQLLLEIYANLKVVGERKELAEQDSEEKVLDSEAILEHVKHYALQETVDSSLRQKVERDSWHLKYEIGEDDWKERTYTRAVILNMRKMFFENPKEVLERLQKEGIQIFVDELKKVMQERGLSNLSESDLEIPNLQLEWLEVERNQKVARIYRSGTDPLDSMKYDYAYFICNEDYQKPRYLVAKREFSVERQKEVYILYEIIETEETLLGCREDFCGVLPRKHKEEIALLKEIIGKGQK